MAKFTNVRSGIDFRADLQIKDIKKFQKSLETRLREAFVFQEAVSDPLSEYNIAITGTNNVGSKKVLTPAILVSISDGPYEIEDNRRLIIKRYSPKVLDVFNYGSEDYVKKIVKMASDAADEVNN